MVSFFSRPSPPPVSTRGAEPAHTSAPAAALSPDVGFPGPIAGVGNIDRIEDGPEFGLEFAEQEVLKRVDEAVAAGKFDLPHLPSTSMMLLELAADADADVGKIERTVATDMVLTASLLKIANSVLYGGAKRTETVRAAILRIGLRGLRSVLYSLSVKSVIFKNKGLLDYAQEVWRQSASVATTSRALAVPLCLDPERTFVLGLLHDVGKIPLLELLRQFLPKDLNPRRPFVGAVFRRHHEQVGLVLTKKWNLPEEVIEVSGCHHEWPKNPLYSKSAALVNLAHRQDLHLSSGDECGYLSLAQDPALEALGLPAPHRQPLLDAVKANFVAHRRDPMFA